MANTVAGTPLFWWGWNVGHAGCCCQNQCINDWQADVMARPDLKTVHMLKKSPRLQVVNVRGYAHYTIPMVTNQEPEMIITITSGWPWNTL